ncbi:carboxypeptidase M32 [Pseudoalteromonas sp. SMS1]|uniref:carboxypeptidase M32 n=1 Tax=Pseudoalteromonas sp. SMS1 TaxID=2908894 RepID=UPI001F419F7F|nr:carboxypeptidase M32 [Pseudoalteromonas sp. SMS1]MCF2860394.1 carboxypeptidase M32 [Pseudoalteromonas sp. SMS1]
MKNYQKLVAHYQSISNFEHVSAICSWDQATNMPSGGAESRAQAMAELAVHLHKLHTADELEELIHNASLEQLTPLQQASLREIKRTWQHASILPSKLVKAKSLAGAKCEHQWRSQRQLNDWVGFKKHFDEVVLLSQEEAQIRASQLDSTPYDAMLDIYEPGMTSAQLDVLFGDIATWLPDIIQQSTSPNIKQQNAHYPIEEQTKLAHELMAFFGFDFNRGRLDTSVHPFCGGVSQDTRITTRYETSDFLNAMMGVIHETGHACYEQNLPQEIQALPVGKARSMAIHESQSLFYEMQIGRSDPFIEFLSDKVQTHFTQQVEHPAAVTLKSQLQRVQPSLIRVDADEVTYPAHIILRYDIEKALINGDIRTDDIPALWDTKMSQLLGISTKNNYKDGCMQDIHWTDGSFGYFPSYTLGAMYAAQFKAAMLQSIDIDRHLLAGDFSPIYAWLNAQVWQHASQLSTSELLIKATGHPLNTEYFKNHLQTRYCQ